MESGLPATSLVLEITEGSLDIDSPVVHRTLEQLRAAGIHLAMDDFGTGYSTLGRLAQVPMEVLKIDRLFTSLVVDADDEVPLLTAVLAMAGALGLDSVAEGVETVAQAEWLRRSGCRRVQGYLFGAPAPHTEFSARLGRGPSRVPALPSALTPDIPTEAAGDELSILNAP